MGLLGRTIEHMYDASTLLKELGAVESALDSLVGGFDAESVPLGLATPVYRRLDVVEKRVGGLKLLLARKVEEAAEWKRSGYRSPADQLAAISGRSVGA